MESKTHTGSEYFRKLGVSFVSSPEASDAAPPVERLKKAGGSALRASRAGGNAQFELGYKSHLQRTHRQILNKVQDRPDGRDENCLRRFPLALVCVEFVEHRSIYVCCWEVRPDEIQVRI